MLKEFLKAVVLAKVLWHDIDGIENLDARRSRLGGRIE